MIYIVNKYIYFTRYSRELNTLYLINLIEYNYYIVTLKLIVTLEIVWKLPEQKVISNNNIQYIF